MSLLTALHVNSTLLTSTWGCSFDVVTVGFSLSKIEWENSNMLIWQTNQKKEELLYRAHWLILERLHIIR